MPEEDLASLFSGRNFKRLQVSIQGGKQFGGSATRKDFPVFPQWGNAFPSSVFIMLLNFDDLVKSHQSEWQSKKLSASGGQGAQIMRSEAYLQVRRNDEVCSAIPLRAGPRLGRGTFYEAINFLPG